MVEITEDHPPFEIAVSSPPLSPRIIAGERGNQNPSPKELGVARPNFNSLQPETDKGACAQQSPSCTNVPENTAESTTGSLGIKVRGYEKLQVKLPEKKRTAIQIDPYQESDKGQPVCMEKVPPLALWLNELPKDLCRALEKQHPPEFIRQIKEILESIRQERKKWVHDLPEEWKMGLQMWQTGLCELTRFGFISQIEGDKLTKFFGLLLQSKIILDCSMPLRIKHVHAVFKLQFVHRPLSFFITVSKEPHVQITELLKFTTNTLKSKADAFKEAYSIPKQKQIKQKQKGKKMLYC